MEKKDVETLDDPQNSILAKGGKIFMAIENGKPVGCVAMIKMADGGYEVAKMTVEETYRGRGLGKKLLQACMFFFVFFLSAFPRPAVFHCILFFFPPFLLVYLSYLPSPGIDAARMDGAPRLYLESNSSLTPALKLYKSMGFQEIPSQSTVYSRYVFSPSMHMHRCYSSHTFSCDVWMELKL